MSSHAKSSLRVSLVQASIESKDASDNLQQFSKTLATISGKTDLVVLPEMFATGGNHHPKRLAQEAPKIIEWMREQARQLACGITGSLAATAPYFDEQSPSFTNRMLFITPDGSEYSYNKVHLFRMANEHKRYHGGHERCVINFYGWRILLIVCYDLRFPVFCRNQQDYDLMICVANWPEERAHHWKTLLSARAIENQAYTVGVNRVGKDSKLVNYVGDSAVLDYFGNHLSLQSQSNPAEEWLETVTLSLDDLERYRTAFPAWKDRDKFEIDLA